MADGKYEKVPLTPFMESLGFTEPVEVDMESIRAETQIQRMWQPIETVPRDCTIVLLYSDEGDVEMGSWLGEEEGETPNWYQFPHGRPKVYYPPTHWMPLPVGPNGPEY